MTDYTQLIYSLITVSIFLIPIMITTAIIMRWKHITVPILGKKKSFFRYSMMDEARNVTWHRIQTDKLKTVGKFVFFEYGGEYYFQHERAVFRDKGIATSNYTLHNPVPLSIEHGAEVMSAKEVKDAQNDKVVFDLLRFTLSKVENAYLILAAVSIIMIGINLYLTYQLQNSIGTENKLLCEVVHYLFPTTTSC
jgi:hypothetical protein